MMARFYSANWIIPPLIKVKKSHKKRFHDWTPSDKTFWIRACGALEYVQRTYKADHIFRTKITGGIRGFFLPLAKDDVQHLIHFQD